MLYYYKIKKKSWLRRHKLLTVACMSALLWVHLYPGSFANVIPKLELDKTTLTSLPKKITPITTRLVAKKIEPKAEPKVVPEAVTPVTEPRPEPEPINMDVAVRAAKAAHRELQNEGKLKEASELQFSIDLLARMGADDGEERRRARAVMQDIEKTVRYFKAGNGASSKAQILGNYEGGNLAYVYYPNYGVHINPVTTCNVALAEYAKGNNKKVVAIADELLKNAVLRTYPGVGKYYIWEYYFDLEFNKYKFEAPWASGMAQGLVLDVLGKTYKITGDRKYLYAGDLVLNSFKIPYTEGGVTDYDEHGNWYLEVAATNKLRILNGFLFTLYSMHNYYKETGNEKALKLFEAGVPEVKAHLHQYDLGYWSNYSLVAGDRASYSYHKIHVDLLAKLYQTTKIPELKTYSDKFGFYYKYRFFDIAPTHRSFKTIATLTERGIIVGDQGWFGAGADIGRAELVGWIARGRGWEPSTMYKGYYQDIKRDHKDWSYIEAAYDNGIQLADSDGLFRPDEKVSRAELASILCKAFGVSSSKQFAAATEDITNHSDQGTIRLALANGLMDIYEPNYFRPSLRVTREQAANILYKLFVPEPQQQ